MPLGSCLGRSLKFYIHILYS